MHATKHKASSLYNYALVLVRRKFGVREAPTRSSLFIPSSYYSYSNGYGI